MLERLTARCWWMPGSHETDRPALGYVCGDRMSLMVDGGNSPAHQRLMAEAIAAQGLPAPKLAAVTHSHWDHVFGLCDTDALAVACAGTQRQLRRMKDWAWTPEAMADRLQTGEDILFCHENMLREYADPRAIRVRTADVTFEERLDIDLGGVQARLIRLENSHAPDCVIVHVPEERVVYLGDIVYEDLHHQPPCWHLQRRAALLAALDRLDFAWAVPGHQEAMDRDAFFRDMEAALAEDRAAGKLMLQD